MKYSKAATDLLKELEFLYENYSIELRATTQPLQLARIQKLVKGYTYHPEDPLVRETLMEHVGSLPMMAVAFYPHLQDKEVDLGQALSMMAIHDIGELITGDEMTFTKAASKQKPEYEAALKLLHPMYHDMLRDVEAKDTKSAKFAKAIDKINPDILDYLMPADLTFVRFKHFIDIDTPQEIVDLIVKHKRPYMEWNPFMTEFHILLMDRLLTKLKKEYA